MSDDSEGGSWCTLVGVDGGCRGRAVIRRDVQDIHIQSHPRGCGRERLYEREG